MKIFIYGVGGYFESIVYPVLREYKNCKIFLANRRPLVNYNYSKIFNRVYQANDINNFDLYFFSGNPIDTHTFLSVVPKNSRVWLEKPCLPLNGNIDQLLELIIKNNLKVRTGLSRRILLKNVKNLFFKKVIISNAVAGIDTWKNTQVTGGSNFVDGIHAIDFALDMIGDGNITSWVKQGESWYIDINGEKKDAVINLKIGQSFSNEFSIDSHPFKFWDRSTSLSCFKENFDCAINGQENIDDFKINFTKIQNAVKKFNIAY